MQGLFPSFAEREHLDLLHPVRRLFGKRWTDCRLTTVEKNLLGFHRVDDLPGAEAPVAWFSFLRAGYGEKLIRVVAHNRQDVLSLVAAHASLVQVIADPVHHKADLYGLARWLSEVNEQHAMALLQSERRSLCNDGKRLLAHLLRRSEQWTQALPIWEGLAQEGCVESLERLAKYHEHVSKDLHTALLYCEQLPGANSDIYRCKRLRKKLAQSGASKNRF